MRYFLILCFLISISSNVAAHDEIGHMEPLLNEKLSSPIYLSGPCSKIKILEWRPDLNNKDSTEKNNKNINIIKHLCIKSYKKFWKFVQKNGFKTENYSSILSTRISLIPIDSKHRDLNDADDRFYYRSKSYKNGELIPIWGYFQEQADYIYIRNDVQDGKSIAFKETFVHELFHAMSWHYKLYHNLNGNKDKEDEKLANEFENFVLGD